MQELVWGGREDCEHNFNQRTPPRRSRSQTDAGSEMQKNVRGSSYDAEGGNLCCECRAWRGAFGLESSVETYVEHTVEILRDIRRVLRPDGVVFWNIGDSYSSIGRSPRKESPGVGAKQEMERIERALVWQAGGGHNFSWTLPGNIKPKDLCLIPQRVALAAQADGWWVRSDIIWVKPNPMPESMNGWRRERHRVKIGGAWKRPATESIGANTGNQHGAIISERQQPEWLDCPGCATCTPNDGLVFRKGAWRPTDAYENILMLTKSEDYYCDREAVREPLAESTLDDKRNDTGRHTQGSKTYGIDPTSPDSPSWYRSKTFVNPAAGRNLRNVWTFPTQPYSGAHFATFPEELPRRCIKAATSEKGCCPKCGSPWARIVRKPQPPADVRNRSEETKMGFHTQSVGGGQKVQDWYDANPSETLGWRPTCECNAGDPLPCLVLDPFAGSGTTGKVALELGRRAVLLDLAYRDSESEGEAKSGYQELARERTSNVQTVLVQ